MNLRNKVVWLTGASSGIGEALAKRLAQTGCKLALTARRREALEQLALEVSAERSDALAFPGDVTDLEQMKQIAHAIESEWGPVDVLIANAGAYVPTNIEHFDSNEYDDQMKLNFSGALYCIEAVLDRMIQRKSGQIVGVSSLSGYRGLPRAEAYGASKAALINFLEAMRFDLRAHNIRVTIVNPGFVKTPLTDKNEFKMPNIIPADEAAEIMLRGIEGEKKEIHFPAAFSWTMKLLRILPYPLYEKIIYAKVVK